MQGPLVPKYLSHQYFPSKRTCGSGWLPWLAVPESSLLSSHRLAGAYPPPRPGSREPSSTLFTLPPTHLFKGDPEMNLQHCLPLL